MEGFCHEDRKRQRKNWQIRRLLKNMSQQFAISLSDPAWPHDDYVDSDDITSET